MKRVDPNLLEGEELKQWYLRTPDEIEAEREAARMRRFNEFFGRTGEVEPSDAARAAGSGTLPPSGDDGRWQEARVAIRPPAPLAPTGGMRIGIPNETTGISVDGVRGGFFDTHGTVENPVMGPAYITNFRGRSMW